MLPVSWEESRSREADIVRLVGGACSSWWLSYGETVTVTSPQVPVAPSLARHLKT